MNSVLIPAAQLSNDHLARLINQTFADYYLTVWLDAYQFERMCYEEDIDLQKSVVAMIDDVPVGISLFSVRGRQGWISGVGILPLWRRKGIAFHILKHIQATAQKDNLENLRLEVLTQNAGAITLYRRLGFRWERDLLILTLEPGHVSYASSVPGIIRVEPEILLKDYERLHRVRNPWQRALPSLQHRKNHLFGWGLMENEVLVAYILTHIQSGNYAIADLAVDTSLPNYLQLIHTLLVALHSARPDMGMPHSQYTCRISSVTCIYRFALSHLAPSARDDLARPGCTCNDLKR